MWCLGVLQVCYVDLCDAWSHGYWKEGESSAILNSIVC